MEKLKMNIDRDLSEKTGRPILRGVKTNKHGDSTIIIGELTEGEMKIILEVPVVKSDPKIWDCVM